MVAVNLFPSTVWSLVYTAYGFPTIDNVQLLRAEAQFGAWGQISFATSSPILLHSLHVKQATVTSRQ
jgi:hypothetical protein